MQIGGCDRICAPESAREFMKNYSSDHDVNLGEIQEYPFAYHELFNEPEREDILENMSRWLTTHFE
jgi:alpha-beta hydrolase superfamily lysophospholipase